MTKIGIVFLHGAGLNASIWSSLVKEIDLPFLSVDFPNRGNHSQLNRSLDYEEYVQGTVAAIKNWGGKSFIIVAHSISACVGLSVSGHFKNELKGFVAIGSVIPKKNNSFLGTLPFPQSLVMRVVIGILGTKPSDKSIKNSLCTDLNASQTDKIVNEFTPESKALYTTPIEYQLPNVQRLFIKLLNDHSMPAKFQEEMALHFESTKTTELSTGHLPMVSHPRQLAEAILHFIGTI